MSEELRKFLQNWIDWTERGAPNYGPYDRADGLCNALVDFAIDNDLRISPVTLELEELFKADGLDDAYPFGEDTYNQAMCHSTQHTNQKRLAWVRSKLQ